MSKTKASKSKRNDKGQFREARSMKFLAGWWLGGVASLALVWVATRAVISDFGSFRACTEGTGIGDLTSCGKHSLDVGDIILLALLGLSACLSASLLTGAWRATRKGAIIA